jgi:hypothetical protein
MRVYALQCGHAFIGEEKTDLTEFELTEYDLMKMSPFRWIDPYGLGSALMATGFQGFAMLGPDQRRPALDRYCQDKSWKAKDRSHWDKGSSYGSGR